MWKEAVVAKFEVLSPYFSGGNGENPEGLGDNDVLTEV
jgi:hypothetical protein